MPLKNKEVSLKWFLEVSGYPERNLCVLHALPQDRKLKDPAMSTIELDTFDVALIKEKALKDVNFVSLKMTEDLVLLINMLPFVMDGLLLHKMDELHFHLSGLVVFKVVLTGNNSGRSAVVEVNEFKRRYLLPFALFPSRHPFSLFFSSVISRVAELEHSPSFAMVVATVIGGGCHFFVDDHYIASGLHDHGRISKKKQVKIS